MSLVSVLTSPVVTAGAEMLTRAACMLAAMAVAVAVLVAVAMVVTMLMAMGDMLVTLLRSVMMVLPHVPGSCDGRPLITQTQTLTSKPHASWRCVWQGCTGGQIILDPCHEVLNSLCRSTVGEVVSWPHACISSHVGSALNVI